MGRILVVGDKTSETTDLTFRTKFENFYSWKQNKSEADEIWKQKVNFQICLSCVEIGKILMSRNFANILFLLSNIAKHLNF